VLSPTEVRNKNGRARRLARFKKELIAHARAMPARLKAARLLSGVLVLLLSEPLVGWTLAALLAAGVLCALFIGITDDAPTVIDLDDLPEEPTR
jgi:hypothetical protein